MKNRDFQPIARFISETIQDMTILSIAKFLVRFSFMSWLMSIRLHMAQLSCNSGQLTFFTHFDVGYFQAPNTIGA